MNDINDMYSGATTDLMNIDTTLFDREEDDEEDDDCEEYLMVSNTTMLHPNTPYSIKRLLLIHQIFVLDRMYHSRLLNSLL